MRFLSVYPELQGCQSVPRMWQADVRLMDGHSVMALDDSRWLRGDNGQPLEFLGAVHWALPDDSALTEVPIFSEGGEQRTLLPEGGWPHWIEGQMDDVAIVGGRRSWRELNR